MGGGVGGQGGLGGGGVRWARWWGGEEIIEDSQGTSFLNFSSNDVEQD